MKQFLVQLGSDETSRVIDQVIAFSVIAVLLADTFGVIDLQIKWIGF